ncbi:MAG TPA: hypothetical protein VMF11_08070 [Candidatus Baltobacteraceae bacterium]|nr:hypothetical protein [Candidatus Baltobacteraceae bacterium]
MMKERPASAPAEVVIWVSTSLLGVLAGVAAAYGLWSQLHATAKPGLLGGGVAALAAGLFLIAVAMPRRTARLFLIVAACALALAFFTGSSAFAALSQ